MRWAKLMSVVVVVACSSATVQQTNDGGTGKDASGLVQDTGADAGFTTCTPAAASGSFFALDSYDLGKSRDVSMCEYRGRVIMVVNTASYCGYTPEYTPLETI